MRRRNTNNGNTIPNVSLLLSIPAPRLATSIPSVPKGQPNFWKPIQNILTLPWTRKKNRVPDEEQNALDSVSGPVDSSGAGQVSAHPINGTVEVEVQAERVAGNGNNILAESDTPGGITQAADNGHANLGPAAGTEGVDMDGGREGELTAHYVPSGSFGLLRGFFPLCLAWDL